MTPELEAKKNHLVNRSVEIEGFFRELAGTVENHQISRGLKGLSDTMAGIGHSILVQKPTYKETIAALESHSDSIQLLDQFTGKGMMSVRMSVALFEEIQRDFSDYVQAVQAHVVNAKHVGAHGPKPPSGLQKPGERKQSKTSLSM